MGVFTLSVFSVTLVDRLHDIEEGCALARTALSLSEFYDANQLIPRVYTIVYGVVFLAKERLQSLLDPLLRACRLSFLNGNVEHSSFSTMMYIIRCWHAGKNIPVMLNEL